MAKISKREIKEGLESIPIEQILLGSTNEKELTHKQKTFAKQVAMGKTKADAYRHAYDSEGKPVTASANAQKLMANTRIQLLIEAYSRAFEAREYRKPERLRELVIHQLTEMALDPDVKDAQRIKSLELLGKVSEVGAFTERKETKVIHESSKIKEKLLDQLKTIINIDAKEINADDADELLREISDSRQPELGKPDFTDPTTTRPPDIDHAEGDSAIHINPHIQSISPTNSKNTPPQSTDSKEEKNEVETFPPTSDVKTQKEEGEGVSNSWTPVREENTETPPVNVSKPKG
jgi:hypothetical protein